MLKTSTRLISYGVTRNWQQYACSLTEAAATAAAAV